MKKTNLVSILLAVVSALLFGVSFAFINWKQDFDHTSSVFITASIILFLSLVCFIILLLLNKKKALVVPILSILVSGTIYTSELNKFFTQAGINVNASIVDYLSPIGNPTVLSFIVLCVFVVSLFLFLFKQYKWAAIISLAYVVILVIVSLTYTAEVAFNDYEIELILETIGVTVSLASLVLFFTNIFEGEPKKITANENQEVENNRESTETKEDNE